MASGKRVTIGRKSWSEVGSFELSPSRVGSPFGKLVLVDPGYVEDKKVFQSQVNKISRASIGTWYCHIQYCSIEKFRRVAQLMIVHEDNVEQVGIFKRSKEESSGCANVDAGVIGFFDARFIGKKSDLETDNTSAGRQKFDWTFTVLNSLQESLSKTWEHGVISPTGYGDGTYDFYVHEIRGRVAAVKVDFDLYD